MPTYRSPGVYVEERPSAVQPIAGVGTSTAAFIGIFEGQCIFDEVAGHADNSTSGFPLAHAPKPDTQWLIKVGSKTYKGTVGAMSVDGIMVNDAVASQKVNFTKEAPQSSQILITYMYDEGDPLETKQAKDEAIGYADNGTQDFPKDGQLAHLPKDATGWSITVGNMPPYKGVVGTKSPDGIAVGIGDAKQKVNFEQALPSDAIYVSYCAQETPDPFRVTYKQVTETLKAQKPAQKVFLLQAPHVLQATTTDGQTVTIKNDYPNPGQASVELDSGLTHKNDKIEITYTPGFETVLANEVKVCTNFGEFKKFFGDFSFCPLHNRLVHAVYGFFNNGGTRCYVVWEKAPQDAGDLLTEVNKALTKFEAIDDISIIAAPGIIDAGVRDAIVTHCAVNMQDRFAILDFPEDFNPNSPPPVSGSDYAAYYAPWIKVADPATGEQKSFPPSGHIAGIYARVDTNRGVHKAPANERVFGALDLACKISKVQQAELNPIGVNCIREFDQNIKVWGARTIGGDDNLEWKYINVRRLFLFLRESIDRGTQWVVFEPNTPDLWAKITRNITAFLTTVWRSGALFGATPQEAFYVKCDAELNPPEERDLGRVWTEIGVAVAKPAEFVIFRISQWAGPGG